MINEQRVSRVIENMGKAGLSQIVVSQPASLYYLTGRFITPGERLVALYIHESGKTMLVANRLFALSVDADFPLTEYDDTEDSVACLSAFIQPGVLGVDTFWPSGFAIRLMEMRPDVQLKIGSAPVDRARMIKMPDEIERMRVASRLNDQATASAIQQIRAGMTESELGEIHTRAGVQAGADGASFPSLICFGKNCAEPHHSTDHTRLQKGDAIIIDVGVAHDHYASDMTRTVFFGSATEEEKRVYEIVRAANEAGRAATRPGVPLREIDRAARKVIEDAGYGPYFLHRTGHNIGLEGHEPPDVSLTSQAIAEPGMVFSIEPGIYLAGKFGVRVEDLICVTPDGGETLNHLSRELIVVDN